MKNRIGGLLFIFMVGIQCIYAQMQEIQLSIADKVGNSIDGAYIQINDLFWYSDSLGHAVIPLNKISSSDSIKISHISYVSQKNSIKNLLKNEGRVLMDIDLKPLDEVVVKPLDPNQLVKESIELIPTLFDCSGKYCVHTDIHVYEAKDSIPMLYFKGCLNFQIKGKKIEISKSTEEEKIYANSEEQLYPIRVSDFLNIIPINQLAVIQKYKDYSFGNCLYVKFKGEDAIQVAFSRNKGRFTQTGYLVINQNTKAIMAVRFSTNPMKNVMKSTKDGGLRLTDLNIHSVEINYSLNPANKLYEFNSAIYKVQYTNRQKKNEMPIMLITHLNSINPSIEMSRNIVNIKNLFFNE